MCAKPDRKMSVHSLAAYAKERSSSSAKDPLQEWFLREFGLYLQLNYKVRRNGWLPIVDITPYIDPKVLG